MVMVSVVDGLSGDGCAGERDGGGMLALQGEADDSIDDCLGLVDTTGILLARYNQTNFVNGLRLITPPAASEVLAAAPVPEPGTLALFGMGALGLLTVGSRRRAATQRHA